MKITHLWNKTYELDFPSYHLWSQQQIAAMGTWPKLRVGKKGRLVQCMQARVRGSAGDKESPNYLVVRMSDKKLVSWWPYYLKEAERKSKSNEPLST